MYGIQNKKNKREEHIYMLYTKYQYKYNFSIPLNCPFPPSTLGSVQLYSSKNCYYLGN
jgi:hypothetical protein